MKAMKKSMPCLAFLLALLLAGFVPLASAWCNAHWSSDPYNPDYSTHDYLAEHALKMLPAAEQSAIVHNLSLMLYGTEMPDSPYEICDTMLHHVYYNSAGELTDDAAADRAQEEYDSALSYLRDGDYNNADKHIGAMAHYIADLGVFGHVMGAYTDWHAETHHSDYEEYVRDRTASYTSSDFDGYIVYDGSLVGMNARDAVTSLAYTITFGSGNIQPCTWMESNYDWGNSTFKDSAGASMGLAVNYLAEALHKLYLDYAPAVSGAPVLSTGRVYSTSDNSGTGFVYEVIYMDNDGDAPSYVKVYIDSVGNSMTRIGGNYLEGTYYRYVATLDNGQHSYYFVASDNRGLAVRLPSYGSYSGPGEGTSSTPILSAGSVSPSSGTTGTTFTYNVTYQDNDNDAPSYVKAYIDNTGYSMSKVSGTYTGGALYSCQTTLSQGSHTHYFEASDNYGATARLPDNGSYSGPSVTESENVPTENFEVTLTFLKPDGSPLANTTVYYGTSQGQEAEALGTTDSNGNITTTNSALAGQTVYFRSSDGAYEQNVYVGSTGGAVNVALAEAAPSAGFPVWVAVVPIVCAAVGGLVLFLKKRGGKNVGWQGGDAKAWRKGKGPETFFTPVF